MPPRLTFRRTDDDQATDVGYSLDDGGYAAVRIADTSDAVTVAGQLRALAARIESAAIGGNHGHFSPWKKRER